MCRRIIDVVLNCWCYIAAMLGAISFVSRQVGSGSFGILSIKYSFVNLWFNIFKYPVRWQKLLSSARSGSTALSYRKCVITLVGGWWGQSIARAFTRCMMKKKCKWSLALCGQQGFLCHKINQTKLNLRTFWGFQKISPFLWNLTKSTLSQISGQIESRTIEKNHV